MLYYNSHKDGVTPSYYAFGPNIPILSQYEINTRVNAIGAEDEAERAEKVENS